MTNIESIMITRKIYLLAILLVLAVSVSAQNFKQGYIITEKDGEVMGLIDFSTNKDNGATCVFKLSEDAPAQIFLPTDILGYKFVKEGKYYVSREVSINEKKRQVFLEYLVQGMMDLYYYKDYKDSKMEYYFFEDKDGEVTQISKKPNKFDGTYDIVDDKYRNQLTYLFREYPEMSEMFMKQKNRRETFDRNVRFAKMGEFGYDRSDMIEAVKLYHSKACTTGEPCLVFENNSNKRYVRLQFSVYAGMQWVDFKWNLDALKSVQSLNPVVGAIVNVSNPRVSQSLSLYLDASLSGVKGENEVKDETGSYFHNKLSGVTTSFKLGVQYMYPRGKVRPSIGAGYGIHTFISKSNTTYIEESKGNDILKSSINGYYNIPTLYHGFNANIACDYMLKGERSVFLGVSYEGVTAKSDSGAHAKGSMKQNMVQVKVGYRF